MDTLIIKLELSVAEVNVILRSLGQRPYEEVAITLTKVKQQGDAQVAEWQAANPQPAEAAKA